MVSYQSIRYDAPHRIARTALHRLEVPWLAVRKALGARTTRDIRFLERPPRWSRR